MKSLTHSTNLLKESFLAKSRKKIKTFQNTPIFQKAKLFDIGRSTDIAWPRATDSISTHRYIWAGIHQPCWCIPDMCYTTKVSTSNYTFVTTFSTQAWSLCPIHVPVNSDMFGMKHTCYHVYPHYRVPTLSNQYSLKINLFATFFRPNSVYSQLNQ